MIGALLTEGISALRDARGTTESRMQLGLERSKFIWAMVFGATVTVLSIVVYELTGVSAATDRALGEEPSDFMLSWPIFPAMIAGIAAVTAAIIWLGPQFTSGLARLFGGDPTPIGGAVWIYLAALAGCVLSVAIMPIDVVLGLAFPAPSATAGWVSLALMLLSLIASLAVCTQVAQHVFGIRNQTRSLVFVILWLVLSLLLLSAIWFAVYGLLGGPAS
ncbi:MAG: hypothetical protein ACRC56_01905 [Bosea sp. (in: a-proteobacteria)]